MLSVHTPTLRKMVPFLFLPAGMGLLFEIAIAPSAAQKILALALALFCPELTRMAWVDLQNIELLTIAKTSSETVDTGSPTIAAATAQPKMTEPSAQPQQSQQLNRFRTVVVSTIALEVTGFYLTFASLPVGAVMIVLSQFWFNLLASIQLHPAKPVPIVSLGIQDRQAVLTVNAITAGLLCLWPIQSMRLGLAVALLALTTLFLAVKYGFHRSE